MSVPNDPKEVLDAAIEFELQGRKILDDAGVKAQDPLSKATFQFLADQELKHIETIQAFAQALAESGGFNPSLIPTPMTRLQAREGISGLFSQFKSQFEATSGQDEERQKVYTVAMNMEHRGHDFYQDAADQATDESAKKLYTFLAEEENRHFEIIQETAEYLKQPDAFMAIDERWMQI